MNKYYEWKILSSDGRLVEVPPVDIVFKVEYLTGAFSCEDEALKYLKEWLSTCMCRAPENLTLVPFYNN